MVLYPPANFSYVEKTLCRSTLPKTIDIHVEFLKNVKVGAIFNATGRELDFNVEEKLGIESSMIFHTSPQTTNLDELKEWISSSIETLLSLQVSCSLVWLIGRYICQ